MGPMRPRWSLGQYFDSEAGEECTRLDPIWFYSKKAMSMSVNAAGLLTNLRLFVGGHCEFRWRVGREREEGGLWLLKFR